MLIGIEMMGDQTPMCRERGIGRYTRQLVSELVAKDRENRYLLYYYAGLPHSEFPDGQNVDVRMLEQELPSTTGWALEKMARTNPDQLDLLLLTCPFMGGIGYTPTAKPLGGPKLASLVYDLIPAVFPDEYQVLNARWYQDALQTVRRYDGLLTISEATRRDCLAFLGGSPDRIFNISAASEKDDFRFDPQVQLSLETRHLLEQLGINKPFVFNLGGGMEWRKNFRGLVEAFGLLPARVRESHQLVVTCSLSPDDSQRMRQLAGEHGVASQLILTNSLSDCDLKRLYQTCAAFVFPSLYEGFGLPLLEAMQCGAPVIAGNNSSQIEVVGEAGLLVDSHNSAHLAGEMARVLEDASLAQTLRERALVQANEFSWQKTVERAREAFRTIAKPEGAVACRGRARRKARRRLAFFSPLPPIPSGISDYSMSLLEELKQYYSIDLYCDSNYSPSVRMASSEFGCHDYRLFDRHAPLINYHGIVYQMGNSAHHRYIYESLQRHPGVVMLHDFALVSFHLWYARQPDIAPRHVDRELAYEIHGTSSGYETGLATNDRHEESLLKAGVFMNRRVIACAAALAVHDRWNLRQIEARHPHYADRTTVIPQGAEVVDPPRWTQEAIRARFAISPDALVVASFGLNTPAKMNVEALTAFAHLAERDSQAVFLLVGSELDSQLARQTARALRIEHRVRVLGRQSTSDFADLVAITDIGINLRRAPTHGETSATLLRLLGAGKACVVTDVDTFSSYRDDVVMKIPTPDLDNRALRGALQRLAADTQLRQRLGTCAREYVQRIHGWPRVAAMYVEMIERVAARKHNGVRREGQSTHDTSHGARLKTAAPAHRAHQVERINTCQYP